MTRDGIAVGGSGKKGVKRARESTKYTRYTEEQIKVLEKIYTKWSSPNSSQRAQILSEELALTGIDNKQLKVWFQNRRCRERKKKGNDELTAENNNLTSLSNHLREESDSLQIKVAQLQRENEDLRNQMLINNNSTNVTISSTDHGGLVIEANAPHEFPIIIDDLTKQRLLMLAIETRRELISKAIGTTINWIPFPVSKVLNWIPNPASIDPTIYISHTCIGVAARTSNIVVHLDPTTTIDLLKDKLSWSRLCRKMVVFANYPTVNGETIEIINTQYYSPTTMAYSRDFWTLRYTSTLRDGSFVVCEKSVSKSDGDAVPSSPTSFDYVRAKILTSGYLIRSCEGGSMVQVIEHLDLEASSIPEVPRPLYQSPELVAKKLVLPALQYLEHVASEANNKKKRNYGEGPPFLRKFGEKLSREFSDAFHGSSEDGWRLMNADAPDEFYMFIKGAANRGNGKYDGIVCVKSSLHLQGVFPASFMKLLKERRKAWLGLNFTEISPSYPRASCFPFPVKEIHDLADTPVLLGKTTYEDEIIEITRYERLAHLQRSFSSKDLYHLVITNGLEDTEFGACSELIFAPVDRTLPNDAALLSSGFRMILLASNTNGGEGTSSSSAANLTSTTSHPRSILTMAFQFPFETHLQDDAITTAMLYIRHVIVNVRNLCLEMTLSLPGPSTIPIVADPNTVPNMNPNSTCAEANPGSSYAVDPVIANQDMGPNPNPSSSYVVDHVIANPNMGPDMYPGSSYVVDPDIANPNMGFDMNPGSSFDVDPAEANKDILLTFNSGSTYDVDPAIANPDMGPSTNPGSSYAVDPTEANPDMGIYTNQGLSYTVDPVEANQDMVLNYNPGSSHAVEPAIANSDMGLNVNPDTNYLVYLASLMCQSFRSRLGVDLLGLSNQNMFDVIEHNTYAILCFSYSSNPVCLYANISAFNMLETNIEMLPLLSIDKILDSNNNISLYSIFPTLMEQGYIILPRGYCVSEANRVVMYEQAVVWLVNEQDGSDHCIGSAFINWSFVQVL